MGFEPMTSSLPRKCSTPELRRLVFRSSVHLFISNLRIVRDGFLLPMNYWTNQPMNQPERKTRFELATYSLEGYRSTNWATSAFFSLRPAVTSLQLFTAHRQLLTANWQSGERRIRTSEVVRQQIYSLIHLAALESPHCLNSEVGMSNSEVFNFRIS